MKLITGPWYYVIDIIIYFLMVSLVIHPITKEIIDILCIVVLVLWNYTTGFYRGKNERI